MGAGVRVLRRTGQKAPQVLGATAQRRRPLLCDRTRRATQQGTRSLKATRQRGQPAEATRRAAYQHRLEPTRALVAQARQGGAVRKEHTRRTARQGAEPRETFLPRLEPVLEQTTRRVRQGEPVPAPEPLVRFDPPTAIRRQGKGAHATACGRVGWRDDVEGGISRR